MTIEEMIEDLEQVVREDAEYRADIYERMVTKIWKVLTERGYGSDPYLHKGDD